jgi:hypothetical protein
VKVEGRKVLGLIAVLQLATALGAGLEPGMILLYTSNGQSQPPWTVEAVVPAQQTRAGAECVRVRIQRDAARTPPDVTACIDAGVLYQWSESRREWVAQRPVATNRTLTFNQNDGSVVRYDTGESDEVVLGGRTFPVVDTTVTTLDAAGRSVRRLREQFAPSLTTAVAGTFEVPDASAPSGWRAEQTFELRQIVVGAR